MEKKSLFCLCVVLLAALFCATASGAALPQRTFTVTITYDGAPVLQRSYPVPLARYFTVVFAGKNYREICEKRFSGDAEAFFGYLNPSICNDVRQVCRRLSRPPREPSVSFDGETFTYREGKPGEETDPGRTLQNLLLSPVCEVVARPVAPKKTTAFLRSVTRPVATFSTSCASSSPARKHNLTLACARLNGAVIPPSGRLSFNARVGKRTKENGFLDAGVIRYGEYTQGVGGGVCQVSTTLYDAWLLSGQNAPSSRPHSLLPAYVKGGLDAMVSDESDLVLQNDSPYPRYLQAVCDGTAVRVTVYGEPLACEVSLSAELVKSVPYDEYEIVEGAENKVLAYPKPSAVYRSYRTYRPKNGEPVREYLRTSHYLPQKGKKSVPPANTLPPTGTQ